MERSLVTSGANGANHLKQESRNSLRDVDNALKIFLRGQTKFVMGKTPHKVRAEGESELIFL